MSNHALAPEGTGIEGNEKGAIDDNKVSRLYFHFKSPPAPGAAISLWGVASEKPGHLRAIVPEDTPAFKFEAKFENCQAGYYVVRWHVEVLETISIPDGLRFQVGVNYGSEEDTSGSLDVIMPHGELVKPVGRRAIVLEELVVIEPYHQYDKSNEGHGATVVAALSNRESSRDHKYTGLQVEYVELIPFTGNYGDQVTREGITQHVVKSTAVPMFTIPMMTSPVFSLETVPNDLPSSIPIARLAWSKEGTCLAALALWKDTAYITVWDMKFWTQSELQDASNLHRTVATVKCKHGNIQDLPIGIAISANGDQVAVYQEPKIGQWTDGSELGESMFRFRLVTPQPVQDVAVNMGSNAKDQLAISVDPGSHSRANNSSMGEQPLGGLKKQATQTVGRAILPHSTLKHFIGYGAFLTNTKSDTNTFTATQHAHTNAGDGRGERIKTKDAPADRSRTSTTPCTMFAACDGIYLDVFKIQKESKWEHIHSIRLTDLMPTISRRITCKTMMEVISSNRFMWLEDDGLCCTIWNLQEGSNVSYISSTRKATFKSQKFRGNSKMAISPDESVVALARDGNVTTYYARTGIMISNRKFPDHQIEYVAFYGQSSQLFVITRNSVSLTLSSWILDPLQLSSGIHARNVPVVPVPIIGRTIHAFFRDKAFENRGLVCEANGDKIHCYFSHEPTNRTVDRRDGNIVSNTRTSYQSPKGHTAEDNEEAKGNDQYKVRTGFRKKLLRNGDGTMYWVLYVEVVKNDKVIFSFVPEPWMRISASEIRKPEDLQKVYFLPGKGRFVVAGLQTLQIWSLPTSGHSDPSLEFYWSRPRTQNDKAWTDGKGFRSELVGEYYHCIRSVRIYRDHHSGEEAEIKLVEGVRMDVVRIPGEHSVDTDSTFLHCVRSIHLLSATYAYASKMGEKQGKSEKMPLTSREHANAIARFTRGHINRQLPFESFYPTIPAHVPLHRSATLVPPQLPNRTAGSGSQAPILRTRQSSGVYIIESSSLVSLDSIQQDDQKYSGAPVISPDPSTTALNHVTNPQRIGVLRTDSEVAVRSRTFVPDIARETLPRGIVTYVDQLGEKFVPQRNHDKQVQDVVTVLTLLLDQKDLKEDNQAFLEGLLDTEEGEWVPQTDKTLNPIKRAINLGYDQTLETLIAYCVKNAKKSHPAYLIPAVQCLNELLIWYPEVLRDLFMKASYIPAHNSKYVASHAIIANLHIVDWIVFLARFFSVGLIRGRWFSSAKYSDINNYKQPAFSLQSQLPFYSHVGIGGAVNSLLSRRVKRLEERDQTLEPTTMNRSRKIYVSPFQFKPVKHGRHVEVFLSQIAGKDYFDSPSIEATLWFKWNKYGLYFWCIRFMAVVPYFVLVLLITGQQIRVSALTAGQIPTEDEIAARYLPEWRPAFYLTIAWGLALTAYEVFHMGFSTTYFSSLFNYIDLAAYLCPVIGCFLFLQATPGVKADTGVDGGPSQIWILAFGILLLYLNMIFELRIIKPLGIAVNTIINITKKIGWFLVIFIVFLVCFTHALLYVLHTRRYRPCQGDSCNDSDDYPTGYPTGFFQALATTYFFLSGRYDPVESSFEKGTVGFQIMMVIFFIFTVILLLNVLIALMNDAFNESAKEGGIGYWKLVSEVIAEMEMLTVYNQGVSNHDSYPEYIYYCANDEEVNRFQSQFTISEASGLSPENRFVADAVEETRRTIHGRIETLGDGMKAEHRTLRESLATTLEKEGMTKERSCDHDELKQELAELRGLVKELMGQLRAQGSTSSTSS